MFGIFRIFRKKKDKEEDKTLAERRLVGYGPNREIILYLKYKLHNGTYEHKIACKDLKKVVKIVDQIERFLPDGRLENDVASFKETLVNRGKMRMRINV